MMSRLAGVLLASAGWLCTQAALAQPEVLDLGRRDLLVQQIKLDPAAWLGMLRLRLVFAGGAPPASWEMALRGDHAESIDVTSENAATRLSPTPDPSVVFLDLPVPPWSVLSATAGPLISEVKAIQTTAPSVAVSQQMLDGSPIDRFNEGVDAATKGVALGFGRLDVRTADKLPQSARTCTAFRITKGYWLTAGHCVTKDPKGGADAIAASIQPHHYAGQQEPVSQLAATVAATGQASGNWNPRERLAADELDFALLDVPADPGGPAFALRPVPEAQNQNLQLLMHWQGSHPPGKARSAGSCTLMKFVGTTYAGEPDQCYRAMQHGCSSDPGASGAPLVRRDNPQHLVGMNYKGGRLESHNCALGLGDIQRFLCTVKPELAKKVTQCPNP